MTERTPDSEDADLSGRAQALIASGDHARDQHDWHHALSQYQEALWSIGRRDGSGSDLRTSLYVRIGDLQLEAAREAEIARGYYEAALALAESAEERVRLLCRLAESYQRSPRALQIYEEAARLAANLNDDALRAWTAFRKAESKPHVSHAERCRILELGRAVLEQSGLPDSWLQLARGRVLAHAGELLDEELISRHADDLTQREDHTWLSARHHYAVADGLRRVGRLHDAILHAERAAGIYESLGRAEEQAGVLVALAGYRLGRNDIEGARRDCLDVIGRDVSADLHQAAWTVMCKTWPHDLSGDGEGWARSLLDHLLRSTRNDVAAMALHEAGGAERILRHAGASIVDLFAASATRLPWLGHPVDAPDPAPSAQLRGWQSEAGSDLGTVHRSGSGVLLDAAPHKGFVRLDVPRLTMSIEGDFVLQARIHGGKNVLRDTLTARTAAANGQMTESAHGAGGLLLLHDLQNVLRLAAHVREPGEVLAEVRENRVRRTVGRLWMGDGALELRIERSGDRLRMMAGNGTQWQQMPDLLLSGWKRLDVGIYGECPTDMYSIVKASTTRFSDVALQAQKRRPSQAPAIAPLAPRPVPDRAGVEGLLTVSTAMKRALDHAIRAASGNSPVLICGETGTGKELIARAIHEHSTREGPFIALNCAAVARDLLERELFGHVRGAYTGATETRGGLFEAAHGGTLFLDEIGEASLDLQVRLLRVVEEQSIRPVGSVHSRPVDVRILSATNDELEQSVGEGSFRADLYYRLRGAAIRLPPLRQRPEDIPLLAYHALDLWSGKSEPHPGFTESAMQVLVAYPWPGNVRELIHEIHESASNSPDSPIQPGHLSVHAAAPGSRHPSGRDVGSQLQEITEALRQSAGNVSEAARLLGISRSTMYRRMRTVGLR